MDTVLVSTDVRVPPEEAYAFLLDVPGYEQYSEHLEDVARDGDGGPGTEYAFTLAWWKLTPTVRGRVTEVDPPRAIHWEVLGDLDAHGRWRVEPTDDGSRVTLVANYDPDSAGDGLVDLPAFVSLDWVIEKAAAKALEEGRRVVERVVADLEGQRRPVELDVETHHSTA